MYRHVPFLEDVPRGINLARGVTPWSCNCGEVDNWLCRPRCKRCGREQPAHVAANAKKVADRVRHERTQQRSPSRGRSRERRRDRSKSRGGGGGAKGGNKAGKAGGNGGGAGGASGGGGGGGGNGGGKAYADVARRADELRKQLAAERKEKESLARRLAATTSAKEGEPVAKDSDGMDDNENEEESDAAKDLKIQQLQAAIEALEAVVETDDSRLASLRTEREALVKLRREGKPLKAQLWAIERKLDKKKSARKRLETRLSEAWAEAEKARKLAESIDKEQDDLDKEIAQLEADKKDTLRRELEGEDGARAEDAHWEGTVGAIRTRLQIPGTDPSLAAAISASLELLRQQCLQLPALVPQATSTTPAAPAPPVGRGSNSEGAGNGNGASNISGPLGAAVSLAPHGGLSAPRGPSPSAPAAAAPAPPAPAPLAPAVPPIPPAAPFVPPAAAAGLGAEAAAEVTVNESGAGGAALPKSNEDDVEMEADNLLRSMPAWRRKRFLDMARHGLADDDEGDEGSTSRDRDRSPRRVREEGL